MRKICQIYSLKNVAQSKNGLHNEKDNQICDITNFEQAHENHIKVKSTHFFKGDLKYFSKEKEYNEVLGFSNKHKVD